MEYFANKLLGRFKPTEDESREGSSSTTALPNSEAEVQPSGATAPATTSDSTTIAPNAARLPDAQSIYANHEDARAEQPSQATDGGFAAAVKPDGTDCVAALQALSIKDAATGTRPGSAVVEATEQLTDVKTDTALYEETETERLAPAGSLLDAERPVQAPPDTQTFNNLLPRVPDPGDERVGLVSDPVMLAHTPPESHYERPERVSALMATLEAEGIADRCVLLPSCQATDAQLRLAHSQDHIDMVTASCAADECAMISEDNFAGPGTETAARTATGCCLQAVEAVWRGGCRRAMAVVRPPGHHAECQRAMGFCFFNNCAVAALHAWKLGAARVLILDWDVHHGNGVEEILREDSSVLYISLHRGDNFYPRTGAVEDVGSGPGRGFTVNIPWQRGGLGDADYLEAFRQVVEPIVRRFDPELVIVAAGFDAANGDPLGGMRLSPAGFAHMTQRLQQFGGGKVVLALEGGYNLRATADCAAACVRVLLGEEAPKLAGRGASRVSLDTYDLLERVAAAQAPFWPDLVITRPMGLDVSELLTSPKGKRGRKPSLGRGRGSIPENDIAAVQDKLVELALGKQ